MKKLVALVLVLGAVALSGCTIILDGAGQPTLIGDPTVTTELCVVGQVSGSNKCAPGGSYTAVYQLLIAYLVPNGVTAPARVTGSGDRSDNFSRSQSYANELTAKQPPPSGMMWVGFISDVATGTGSPTPVVETLKTTFQLPRNADGSPHAGPFKWLTISGDRDIIALHGDSASDPVACATKITDSITVHPSGGATTCQDGGPQAIAANLSALNTSDFGITVPAAPQSVPAGRSIDVPFNYQFAGPALAQPFSLAASTDIPGVPAAPMHGSLGPAANFSSVEPVHVNIPLGTSPGTYHVTLTATLPNGQSRTQTVSLQVLPVPLPPLIITKDTTPPSLTLAAIGKKLSDALKHGLGLSLACSKPCSDAVTLLLDGTTAKGLHITKARKPVKVGSKTFTLSGLGIVKVRVPFTSKAKKRLAHVKRLVLTVQVKGADANGNSATTSRKVTLK